MMVGRGSSRSLSDSAPQQQGNGNLQLLHQRPVRFRPIADVDAAMMMDSSSNGSNNNNVQHVNSLSTAADYSSSEQQQQQHALARNMRSTEYICCSAALNDGQSLQQPVISSRSSVCLRHRLSSLYGNERMADIHFVLTNHGSGATSTSTANSGEITVPPAAVRVPAHRLLLAVASPVFDAMFNGQMAVETSANADVHIPDVEMSAFMSLLRFIYTDQVDLSPESVMAVLYAAKKYAVDSLQERCVDFLRSKLNKENAFLLLAQARLFDEPQLAALCLDVIDRHTNEAMATESFLEIDADTLCAVLSRDTLCIRENRVFSHVHRWADAECTRLGIELNYENKRRVLGSALHMIRFPLMTPEEFANDAAQSGLLDNTELVSLFLWYLATPKPSNNLPLFSAQPRCCTAGRELTAARFQHVELRWGYSGTADKIKFTVSRPIYVVGLGLYGSVTSGSHYSTIIQLIHCESREVRGQNEVEYDTDGSKKPFLVRFSEPVAIDADTPYLASCTIRGPDTFYGTRGQRRVVVELTAGNGCNNNNNNNSDGRCIIGSTATSSSTAAAAAAAAAIDDDDGRSMTLTMANNNNNNNQNNNSNGAGDGSGSGSGDNNNNNNGKASSSSSSSSSSVTFSFSYACSSNNGTSVEDGQIPEIVFFA